jgi:hypothetical protein
MKCGLSAIMEQNYCEKIIISHLLKKFQPFMEPRDYYRVRRNPPLFPILNRLNLLHNLTPSLHFNIILLSTSSVSKRCVPLKFSD